MPDSEIYVQYGEADTLWDASFTEDQLEELDIDPEMIRHISVSVDPDTGKIELNAGYEPGSEQHRAESALFDEHRDAIREAIVAEVSCKRWLDRGEYDALRARAPAPSFR